MNTINTMNAINVLDQLGAIFSLLATYYLIKASLLAWPVSLVAVSISILLYYQVGLYGDAGLAVFYFFSAIYGWYIWSRSDDQANKRVDQRQITDISTLHAMNLSVIAVTGILILYFILTQYTDSNVALFDAITTVLSLIAQWLMCRKIIQTWLLWFIIDAINIVLYAYKGIPYHAVLMTIYLVMAVIGYVYWQKQMIKHTDALARLA